MYSDARSWKMDVWLVLMLPKDSSTVASRNDDRIDERCVSELSFQFVPSHWQHSTSERTPVTQQGRKWWAEVGSHSTVRYIPILEALTLLIIHTAELDHMRPCLTHVSWIDLSAGVAAQQVCHLCIRSFSVSTTVPVMATSNRSFSENGLPVEDRRWYSAANLYVSR